MAININHEVKDTFYRYKMPVLSAKVEGKGNGVRTVIVNVTDIAKALYRKPIYVTKFFGCELGTLVHVDEKNDRYIINGAHEAAKLQELLQGFIKKFVLCQNCGNPETALTVKSKAGVVTTTCKACGHRGELDLRHRLTQYIIKNPPAEDSTTSAGKPRAKKNKKTKNGTETKSDVENECSSVPDDSHNSPEMSDDDNDDWGEDVTEEAQEARRKELSTMARSLAMSTAVEKTETERANLFFKRIVQLKQEDNINYMAREVLSESNRLNLGGRAVVVVVEVLLSDPESIVSDINKYKSVFLPFTRTGPQAQKAQTYVLGAVISLIDKHSKILLSKSCHILKGLYDCDIIEEEVILSWFNKMGAKRYVSDSMATKITEVVQPMLTWLAEAEEESEEDGEDEENGVSDESHKDDGYADDSVASPAAKPSDNSNDETIDIDAI